MSIHDGGVADRAEGVTNSLSHGPEGAGGRRRAEMDMLEMGKGTEHLW